MGKKIRVLCLYVIMIAFFSFSIRNMVISLHISREKGDHYYVETRHKDLFPHFNLIIRKL